MKRTYPMIIEQGKDGLFGSFPDLPGLTVGGDTAEELVALAREFMVDYLADCMEKGGEWPEASPTVAVVQVDVEETEVLSQAAKAQPR